MPARDLSFRVVCGSGRAKRSIVLKAADAESFNMWYNAITMAVTRLQRSHPEQRIRRALHSLGIRPVLVEDSLRNLPLEADVNDHLDFISRRVALLNRWGRRPEMRKPTLQCLHRL